MAKEILSVPEECLLDVIAVIRAGLETLADVPPEVRHNLTTWCDEEEAYILGEEGDE